MVAHIGGELNSDALVTAVGIALVVLATIPHVHPRGDGKGGGGEKMRALDIIRIVLLAQCGPTGINRPVETLRERLDQEVEELLEKLQGGGPRRGCTRASGRRLLQRASRFPFPRHRRGRRVLG